MTHLQADHLQGEASGQGVSGAPGTNDPRQTPNDTPIKDRSAHLARYGATPPTRVNCLTAPAGLAELWIHVGGYSYRVEGEQDGLAFCAALARADGSADHWLCHWLDVADWLPAELPAVDPINQVMR